MNFHLMQGGMNNQPQLTESANGTNQIWQLNFNAHQTINPAGGSFPESKSAKVKDALGNKTESSQVKIAIVSIKQRRIRGTF